MEEIFFCGNGGRPFVADIDTAFKQHILDLAKRQRIADVQHHREADDFGRTVEITEGVFHPPKLRNSPYRLKPLYSDNAIGRPILLSSGLV